jgi:muconolactone D-isomerase
MEFLVEFEVNVPEGAPESEVDARFRGEETAAAALAREGHLVRVWKVPVGDASKVLALYRADSESQLVDLLRPLPLWDWMRITITTLEPHPNDPAVGGERDHA